MAQKKRADEARAKLQAEQPKPTEIQQAILDNPQVKRGEGSLGKLTREEKMANLADLRLSASGTTPTGDDREPMDRYQSSLNRTPLATQEDFGFVQDEPPESTGDPIEDRVQLLTWERNQALKQAQAVTEASKDARQSAEDIGEDMFSQAIQQRGQALEDVDALGRPIRRDALGQQIGGVGANNGAITQGEMINPAYQDLTLEEKKMNMYDIDPKTGQPIRRSAPRIAETVDYNKTIQNAKLYASPNAGKYRNKSNAEIVKMINSEDINALKEDVKNLKIDLGLERGQSLTVNESGEVEIIDDETGEIFDPVKRAEDRYNRETAEQVEEAQENHEENMNYIKATYTKSDGTLTAQGKRMILKTQKDYNETINRYERDRGEQLESVIKQEKARQQEVESLSQSRGLTIDERISREEQAEYTGLINDYINQSKDEFGRPTIGLLEASRMAKSAKSKGGAEGVKNLRQFQTYMSSQVGQNSTPDSMFQKAYELTGKNATDALGLIKDSFGANMANHAMAEWEKSIGYDEESIELSKLKRTKEDIIEGENDPSGIRLAQLFKDYNALDPTGSLTQRLAYSVLGAETTNPNQREMAKLQLRNTQATQSKIKESASEFEDVNAKQIAENIFNGVGDINDVLTKNRQPVLYELSKLKDKAMESGDLRGVLTASAVFGDKSPSDTFLQSFSKGRSVLNQLGELKRMMMQDKFVTPDGEEVDMSPLSGWLAEVNPWDTDAQEIKAILQQTVPNLARGVFGEVGVLTDKDVELYKKTLPTLRSTDSVKQAVMGITLRAVQRSLENQIETQALGGRNMSRFAPAYDDIVSKTDDMMGLRDLPQTALDAFNQADRETQNQMIETAKNSFFRVAPLRQQMRPIETGEGEPMTQTQGYRTDRHNNPTAMTIDVAKQGGLVEGVDYEVGDVFPDNPNLKTAKLIGDPIEKTIDVIDNIGFYTGSGSPRWTHTAMTEQEWDSLSYDQKKKVVMDMYQKEGGNELLSIFA